MRCASWLPPKRISLRRTRLVWFIDEQIEEEENVQGIIDALKLVGDDKVGTFMLDKELAGRVYASPVAG